MLDVEVDAANTVFGEPGAPDQAVEERHEQAGSTSLFGPAGDGEFAERLIEMDIHIYICIHIYVRI